MLAFRTYWLFRFTALCWPKWFLNKVIIVGGTSIKFVPWWKIIFLWFFLFMGICIFLYIACFICGVSFKWLIIWNILLIFILYRFSWNIFSRIFIFILWLPIERIISILIFNSWYNFLSHLWFVTWVMSFVRWI